MIQTIAAGQYDQLTRFDHPWPFYVVDNFLDPVSLKDLIYLSKQNNLTFVDCWDNKAILSVEDKTLPAKRSLLLNQFNNLSNSIKKSIDNHLSNILPAKHFYIPDLIVCDPGYKYGPHKDHPDKKITIVVFVHPTMSDATILRHSGNSYSLKWRVNRALIFKQEEHGIHYYINSTQYPRVTLNVYITTDSPMPFQVTSSTPV